MTTSLSTISNIIPTLINLPFCHSHQKSTHFLSPPHPNFLSPHTISVTLATPLKKIQSFSSPKSSSSSSSSMAAASSDESKPFSVLFVCLGNICRSPAAEGVFKEILKSRGLDSAFSVDSAGTINYHEGNPADPRMRAAAKTRGIEITSISRPVRPSDFKEFDLILAMDKQNREDLMNAFERWKFTERFPDEFANKVKLMCSYCKKHDETEVPDPYYGGQQGFEKVLDLLEDACESLLDSILAENNNLLKS